VNSPLSMTLVRLTTDQATDLQTLLRKNPQHFEIKSTKHKPLARQTMINGTVFNVMTRLVSEVENRKIYRCSIFVVDQKKGTMAPVNIIVVRNKSCRNASQSGYRAL